MTLRELVCDVEDAKERLNAFGISNATGYSELLVARALQGKRHESAVHKGCDVVSKLRKRVEVKYRRLPKDGRQELRVAFGEGKLEGFDFAAIIAFDTDFRVKGATLVPYQSLWPVIERHKYRRIGYHAACRLNGAVDITSKVLTAQHEVDELAPRIRAP